MYKSNLGTLTCNYDNNLGCVALNKSGINVGKLVLSVQKPKVLEKLLNRNLEQLTKYLDKNPQIIELYNTWDTKVKLVKISEIINTVEALSNHQWIQGPIDSQNNNRPLYTISI